MRSPSFRQYACVALAPLLTIGGMLAVPAFADVHTITLETTHGDIVLELDENRAPETVENFLSYVDDGFYNETIFHRVIEGFMIQGGGFTPTYQRKATRSPIRNEANNGLSNRRYTIAMARTNSPHSATAQFFINTVDNRNLDHTSPTARGWGYTVFGSVVDGEDIVQTISETPTGAGGPFSSDVPRDPVIIQRAYRHTAEGQPGSGDEQAEPAGGDTPDPSEPALDEPALGASDEDSSSRLDILDVSSDGAAAI